MALSSGEGRGSLRTQRWRAGLRRLAAAGVLVAFGPAVADPADTTATAPAVVAAAPDKSTVLGEVIVSAERRDTNVQKTPVSVGVIGSGDIDQKDIKRLWDANGSVPGLYLSSYPSNMQSVFIRGIGTADPGVFSAVGYYLDDVYLGRAFGRGAIDFPDIQRIEVLRGPQGTLYGQNTSGGAVKFISLDPSFKTQGWASLSLGNFGAQQAHLYFTGPLIPGVLSGSIAYSHRQDDGDTWNAYRNVKIDRLFVDQYRGKLRYTPVAGWEAVLAVDGTHDASDNYISTPNNGPSHGAPRIVYANTDSQMLRRDLGETLKVTGHLDDHLDFKSVTAHRFDPTDPHPWDSDGLSTDLYGWNQHFTEQVFSQEFLLTGNYSRLRFTSGANYYHEKFDFNRLQWLNLNYTNLDSHVRYYSYAVYGQADYKITDALSFTAGLRLNVEHQHFIASSFKSDINRDQLALNYLVPGATRQDRAATPKFALDYQINRDLFSYFSWTSGVKSGGFNRAAGTQLIASMPVAPERVKAYELGLKSTLWHRRVTANFAGFYNKYDQYQATVTNPTINGQIVNGNVIVNAGKAHTEGVELESALRPLPGLRLQVTGAWLNTEFDNFVNPTGAANANYTGHSVPNAPKWTGAVSGSYALPLGFLPGQISVNSSLSYIQSNYTDIANTPAFKAGTQSYLNGGADYASADGHWDFRLYIKNALNRDYVLARTVVPSLGTDTTSYNPPRTFLATLRYDFY
jgi:iron complex outermembrane receptor protein